VIEGSTTRSARPAPDRWQLTYTFASGQTEGLRHNIVASTSATHTATYQAAITPTEIVKNGSKNGSTATWKSPSRTLVHSPARTSSSPTHSRLDFASASPGCAYAEHARRDLQRGIRGEWGQRRPVDDHDDHHG
jgi:hypothetical protein